ncbi:MAG: M28 family peptidase [Coriobacteriia bacterium]|nr:M28 family peptidase [Coriobacteriia bacterium]
MPEAIQYVRELADRIGPRPATTDAEAEAADYIQDVFTARGLDVERQEFVCPRTYSWSYVLYHLLTLGAVGSVFWPFMRWPAFAIAALSAFLMWTDLDTRFGLSNIMPKGPSQNIIARRIPKTRRNERATRIVVVAHYDSARSSVAFSPGMVKNFALTFGFMKWCTFLAPVVLLANALPIARKADPYLWYGAIAVVAYLVIPLVINIHRELFMQHVDGANDNASGVAAMLGVMEAVVPEPEGGILMSTQPIRGFTDAFEPVASHQPSSLPDDFRWADAPSSHRQPRLDLDTVDFEPLGFAPVVADDDDAAALMPDEDPRPRRSAPAAEKPKRGLFGRGKSKSGPEGKPKRGDGVGNWLGVDNDFDARQEGRKIGSWDGFEGEEDEGWGDKGGSAGGDFLGDPDYAADEASRIRWRVTEHVDRSLAEKEVWFVATGAEEVGTYGMQALLKDYADELKGALIINIDGVGSGKLHWITAEGMARSYKSTPRLMSTAKRVARDLGLPVTAKRYKGLSTDATPALARGFKAMSVMAFDINDRIPNWHWKTDTADTIDEATLERAVEFVTGLVREL